MTKYHAIPTVVDGIRFASKAEARRYQELRLMQRAEKIGGLTLQPRFKFPMGFAYVGDFQYLQDGRVVVEDVKGFVTPVFRIKAACFRHFYPKIELRIVK